MGKGLPRRTARFVESFDVKTPGAIALWIILGLWLLINRWQHPSNILPYRVVRSGEFVGAGFLAGYVYLGRHFGASVG